MFLKDRKSWEYGFSHQESIMSNYSIGVDLGGTKILAGVVNTETGEVIDSSKKRTKKS